MNMANIVEIKDLKKSYENGNIKALNGINLEIEEGDRGEEIGFIFQLHNLIPNTRVGENIEIPMYGHNKSSKEMREKSLKLLDMVGLKDKANMKPNKLSGGERQRVAIARALANNPSIILADEPTGSLDSKTSTMILNQLHKLHKDENITLIMVTHDLTVAKLADRIIEVLDGKIINAEEGTLLDSKIELTN